MFTGIVSDIGEVVAREDGQFSIRTSYAAPTLEVGASMACDGCCLTLTSVRADGKGAMFTVDTSNETRAKTTLADWSPGRRINLERPLQAGAELGGHVVTGHVDGRRPHPRCPRRWRKLAASPSRCPIDLARYIAPKGSIALDGSVVNGQRGERQPFRRQHHSPHLDRHDVGRQNPRTIGSTWRSTCSRAMSRGPWSSARERMKPVRSQCREGKRLPSADRRDHRGSAQRPYDHPRRRGGPRERGRPRHSRADGDARRDQLHGQARPRPRLPVAYQPARARSCGSKYDGAPERGAQPHRLHPVSIEAREGISPPASPRTTARAPSPPPSTRPRTSTTSSRPATSSR